jgi:uncharacterized protein with ATP-grasp and redox domains
MRTYEKCLSCFERQASDCCAISRLDTVQTSRVLNAVRRTIASFSRLRSPVEMAVQIHKTVRAVSGIQDPYDHIKEQTTRACKRALPDVAKLIERSSHPVETAVMLAVAGNMLDFGVYSPVRMGEADILRTVAATLAAPLLGNTVEEFMALVYNSSRVLYIGDNAGECFFDRILLDFIPSERVTYIVRGGPVLNDATVADAQAAGIDEVCRIIDTGDNAPGILPGRCSGEFREAFMHADMIIAKGQGNYESLSDCNNKTRVFLTKVKCDPIAEDIGEPVGSNVLRIRTGGPRIGEEEKDSGDWLRSRQASTQDDSVRGHSVLHGEPFGPAATRR